MPGSVFGCKTPLAFICRSIRLPPQSSKLKKEAKARYACSAKPRTTHTCRHKIDLEEG